MSNLIRFPSTIADAEARTAALDTRASCIVEAPAGSGKTGLLIQRFLKLLAGEDIAQPEEVLAITFTNKATAELRERILAQLGAAQLPLHANASSFDRDTHILASAALARAAELHWEILIRPERLNIRTIDSVCAEISNALPLLSGSGGPRQPIPDADPLHRLAAQRTLGQLGGHDRRLHDALHNVLLHRDASLRDCETLVARMLAQREQWGELVPLGAALDDVTLDTIVRPDLERSLEAIVCNGLSRAMRAMPHGLLAELTSLAARLGLEPGYKGSESPLAICADKFSPPEAKAEHLDHWVALISLLLKPSDGKWRAGFNKNHVGFEIQKSDALYLKQLVDSIQNDTLHEALSAIYELPPTKYPDEQWAVAKSLFHVLNHALIELKLLFAERGQCDFPELALAAREALSSDNAAVDLALTSGGRLRHLLVDELQDTSSAQYDLIQQLTRTWDGCSQTLFLVGDPKQSIYLFRQARVERFLRTMREQRLGDIHLTPLHLTSNFRSQATLVDSFNHTFELLFPTPEDATRFNSEANDVPFVPATPTRPPVPAESIAIHAKILNPAETRRDHDIQQARDIRAAVESRLARPLPQDRARRSDGTPDPWRIAILARVRNHFAPIVAELKRANISYRAVDIDPLDQRQEVLDALALTRALLHPADRVAWLAVLHAPWCGLSLADMLMLTADADICTPISVLVVNRRHLLSADGQSLLARAWPTLAAALSTLGASPLSTHVERTWRSLGGDASLGQQEQVNVLRYLAVLREVELEPGGIDLTALTSRLNSLYAEPASGECSVELLTIHKAKGLEWDVVLVPNLERKSGSSSSDFLNWLELDSAESSTVILAPIWGKGQDSDKLNIWLRNIRAQRERTEEKRLFYVACTRAREELHLFAARKAKLNGDLALPDHGSLLKSCLPAFAEAFALAPQPVAVEPDAPTLALAAAAELPPPILHRLPLNFNPLARFDISSANRLPYPASSSLPHAPAFDRPDGSFAVRAFGNVVHRFLQLIATRLENGIATGTTPDALIAELPEWQLRLVTALRAEGLAPTAARRDADRALQALQQSLADPEGLWLLSPHNASASEQPLTSVRQQDLRADRTFFAGPTPLASGSSTFWIVDFKTATGRALSSDDFRAAELAKYSAQLETYARIRRSILPAATPIRLALYYPLLPRLIHWESRVE